MIPNMLALLRSLLTISLVGAFAPLTAFRCRACERQNHLLQQTQSTGAVVVASESPNTSTSADTSSRIAIEPAITVQQAVKLFGKLAEKFIMLDATGGMCCYSGCSDCEYREPGGGYRMADQSASRPKWIPTYDRRQINDKQHTSKWSTVIYNNDNNSGTSPTNTTASSAIVVVTKEQFVQAVVTGMSYAPILGGPNIAASAAASIDETNAAGRLFDILADGKEVLTKHRMMVRLKQLSGGDEGLVWPQFQQALLGAS